MKALLLTVFFGLMATALLHRKQGPIEVMPDELSAPR